MSDNISSNVTLTESSSIFDDFGITPFVRSAKAHKRLLFLVPIFWLLISNIWFWVARTEYMGEIQVIPATTGMTPNSGHGLGELLSSGLGGLLGSGAGSDSMFSIYTESWTAPWFAEEVLQNDNLIHRIFRDHWSAQTKSWKPSGFFGHVVREIFGARQTRPNAPTGQMVLDYLNNHIKILHNRSDVMTLVTFKGPDKGLIRDLLNFGHQHITDHIRQIYKKRAQGSIANILSELQHVTVSDYRTTLLQELAQQEKIRMLAYANDQFAAQSLGLYITDTPVWPRTGLIVILSLVFSLMLYIVCVLVSTKLESLKLHR